MSTGRAYQLEGRVNKGKAANKKGSQDVLNGDLRTFVVKKDNPKDPKKPKIMSVRPLR